MAFTSLLARSVMSPQESQVGKDLPHGESLVKLKKSSLGVEFVVVFKRDRRECKASDKTVSQHDTGRSLDLRAEQIEWI